MNNAKAKSDGKSICKFVKNKNENEKYKKVWERYKTAKLTVTTKQKTEKTRSVNTKTRKDIPMKLSFDPNQKQKGNI